MNNPTQETNAIEKRAEEFEQDEFERDDVERDEMAKALDEGWHRFKGLARPSWKQSVEEARARMDCAQRRRPDGRRRQFSTNIANRAQLDALSEKLDLARSEVINLGLDLLGQKLSLGFDFYTRLFTEFCEVAADIFHDEYAVAPKEAVKAACRFALERFPRRKTWIQVLRDAGAKRYADASSETALFFEGKEDAPTRAQCNALIERFIGEVDALLEGRYDHLLGRWISKSW